MTWRITLLTNPDICNLKCNLCFLNQRKKPFGMGEMPLSIAKAAINKYEILGRNNKEKLREVIPSTMGEPLLYSKFSELLDFCKQKNLKLNITTNGTFANGWANNAKMIKLLKACSDIKISTLPCSSGGFSVYTWAHNVIKLLKCRDSLKQICEVSTVSLQVTLDKIAAQAAFKILHFANSVGIDRIKWNVPIFLECAPKELKEQFSVPVKQLLFLRNELCKTTMRTTGSLFISNKNLKECPFKSEVWIYPNGTESFCPNPELRFGNPNSPAASCKYCVISDR